MRLNHNLMSLNVFRSYSKNLNAQSTSIGRISSGNKINSAGDNPNGLGKMELMKLQVRGLQMAQKNMQDGVSMLQTAEGGLENITDALNRIRQLAVSAGGATTESDKAVIQQEIEQMVKGIDNTAEYTEFNGLKLLANEKTLDNNIPEIIHTASGSNVGERIEIPMYNLTSSKLNLNKINITEPDGINKALNLVDGAIDTVVSVRSKYGALENRFESMYDINGELSNLVENSQGAIEGADIAEEMMNLAKSNLLVDSGNALLAQTNRMPQDVLGILERLK